MSLDEFNLLTVPKFAAGAASNFVTQSGRALGNVVAGGAKSALSAARVGLGGLQMLGGGREPGWDNVKKGWEGAEKAGLQIGRGALQAAGALSGATPLLRGAQAASEKITDVSGVYSPKGKGTLQDMFGMNNWGGSKGAEKPGESAARSKPTSRPTSRPAAGQQKVASKQAAKEDSEEGQKLWQNLLAAYKGAAGKDKERLHNTIMTEFPIKYADAMARKEAKKMMSRVKK